MNSGKNRIPYQGYVLGSSGMSLGYDSKGKVLILLVFWMHKRRSISAILMSVELPQSLPQNFRFCLLLLIIGCWCFDLTLSFEVNHMPHSFTGIWLKFWHVITQTIGFQPTWSVEWKVNTLASRKQFSIHWNTAMTHYICLKNVFQLNPLSVKRQTFSKVAPTWTQCKGSSVISSPRE